MYVQHMLYRYTVFTYTVTYNAEKRNVANPAKTNEDLQKISIHFLCASKTWKKTALFIKQ